MLEKLATPLLGLAARAAAAGADPGHRPRGQRQPSLAARGRLQLPGLRGRARAGADLDRELRRAPREGAARDVRRTAAAARPADDGLLRGCCSLEPDFGAATVLFVTGFGVLFLAGARLRWVLRVRGRAPALGGVLMSLGRYRMRRLTAFIDPWAHAVRQRLPADPVADRDRPRRVVRRRASARACRSSSYLPEAHTDFLFAVLAEELGLVGVVLTLGCSWRSCGACCRSRGGRLKPA
jgi:hypothetical protein